MLNLLMIGLKLKDDNLNKVQGKSGYGEHVVHSEMHEQHHLLCHDTT
jgi:hypothetical protein